MAKFGELPPAPSVRPELLALALALLESPLLDILDERGALGRGARAHRRQLWRDIAAWVRRGSASGVDPQQHFLDTLTSVDPDARGADNDAQNALVAASSAMTNGGVSGDGVFLAREAGHYLGRAVRALGVPVAVWDATLADARIAAREELSRG